MFSMTKNEFAVWELPQDAIARYGQGILIDLAVSADGASLAVGSWAGVWWYDLTTRTPAALLESKRGMVDCIALCSDQPWLALKNTDKDGNEVIKIWDMQIQKRIAVMEYPTRLKENPPKNDLCSLCFSSSGQWLAATRGRDVIVDIWESVTGRLHAELKLSPEEIELCSNDHEFSWDFSGALAFSPDNRLFVSSHWSDFISVWDITTCEHIIRFTGHPEGVHALSFSPCGQFLAAGGVKGTVQVWDTSTWQLQQTYTSFGDYQMNISYAPDGTLRAAGISPDEYSVAIWDVAQREKRYTFEGPEIRGFHFSTGAHLALKSDFEIKVKTVENAETLSILPWELGDLHSLVFSPDGKTLAAGYRQFGGVILWDATTHSPQRIITEPRCETSAVFSNTYTGKLYTSGFPPGEFDYWDNILNLWELGRSEPIAELTVPGELPNRRAMAYAPTANLLACGNGTKAEDSHKNDPEIGAVYVWDVQSGQMRHIFRGKHTDGIDFVKFSPDGTRLISGDTDGTNRVSDVICGEEIDEFPGNFMMHKDDYKNYEALTERFEDVAAFSPQVFSSCGNLIAGRFSDDRILVWDIEQCETRVTIHIPLVVSNTETNIPSVDPIEFSPCGQYLAYGEVWEPGVEKVPVRLWDIRTGENIVTFLGHPTDIQCLAFSPDSTLLASGSFDGTILLWDLKPYLRNT